MKFKQALAKCTNLPTNCLPRSYQILGHVLLFKLPKQCQRYKREIARAIPKFLPYVKTVALQHGIKGVYRKPKIEILFGSKNTEVLHKELGCYFKLDVAKLMWSKGNHAERARMIEAVKDGETILDMFAGVGYWSIPIAKHKSCKVFAIEKNPVAFSYLQENIRLNRLSILAIKGDCRKVIERYDLPKVDRIIMGYFPGTIKFLPWALKTSKSGTIIHFHECTSDLKELCKEIFNKANGKLKIKSVRLVKEYSPSKQHYVLDLIVK